MPNVTAEIAVLQEQMKTTTSTLDRIERKVEDGFAGLDKKYASKLSERIVYGLVAVILLFVLNGWLGLFKLPSINVVAPGTTATAPKTSASTISGGASTPGSSSTANAQADAQKPSDSQTVVDGVVDQVKKVAN